MPHWAVDFDRIIAIAGSRHSQINLASHDDRRIGRPEPGSRLKALDWHSAWKCFSSPSTAAQACFPS
ncbi:hypothetical protein E4U53_001827 [Claviceps sorghi]|nr:hypothetical protein E4U53_001827 [Claviceps sorghi]